MARYELNGHWYTTNELSEMSGIAVHTLRDRLRRGFSVEEAIKLIPIHECVKAFNESSFWEDWIAMSIDELHKIFWNWCISNGYSPISKQGFSRQLFSMYPNLKIVPTKIGDRYDRIIREIDWRD